MRCSDPRVVKWSRGHVKIGDDYVEKWIPEKVFPCGQCMVCREDRKNEWVVRMNCEYHMVKHAHWIGLSYSDDYLPKDYSVDERHMQLFFKRLRKRGKFFKYYYCGEYGEDFGRAHYHVVLYHDYDDSEKLLKDLRDSWKMGFVYMDLFDFGRTLYVVDYLDKKGSITHFNGVKLRKPFARMSKGLGLSYLRKYEDQIVAKGYINLKGFKYKIPRYFIKKSEKLQNKFNDQEYQLQLKKEKKWLTGESKNQKLFDIAKYDYEREIAMEKAVLRQQELNLKRKKARKRRKGIFNPLSHKPQGA